jgi:glycosyltransferase involved in cell wall biosynthesis
MVFVAYRVSGNPKLNMPSVLYIAEKIDMPEACLLKGVHEAGWDIALFLTPWDPYFETLTNSAFKVMPMKFDRGSSSRAVREIRRYVKDHKPDVVHCLRKQRVVSHALKAVRKLDVPLIGLETHIRSLHALNPLIKSKLLKPRVDKVICVANSIRLHLENEGVPRERLVTIYKGHDVHWYDRDEPADFEEFEIPDGEFVVGCVANMRPQKGIVPLLQAIKFLPPEPRVHFLLVGHVFDERITDLAATNRTTHQIHLPGFRSDAARLMGSCDVFILPSLRNEGLPIALLEAMSQAVPAIVTPLGGMKEVVEHRVSGRIVRPGDPQDMARSITTFVKDRRYCHECGQNARKRIREHFNIDRMILQTLRLYNDLVPPSRDGNLRDSPGSSPVVP